MLYGGEWSASRSGCFIPEEGTRGTHWVGGWVGPRTGLDAVAKRKIPSPFRESNPNHPAHSQVALPTELSRYCRMLILKYFNFFFSVSSYRRHMPFCQVFPFIFLFAYDVLFFRVKLDTSFGFGRRPRFRYMAPAHSPNYETCSN
jgi:hypothetical protein